MVHFPSFRTVHLRAPWLLGFVLLAITMLSACDHAPASALGSIEYDRIVLPAPASERIRSIDVQIGQKVRQDQQLMQLDVELARQSLAAADADRERLQALLDESTKGPRAEAIERARAAVAQAQVQARDARQLADRAARIAPGTVSAAERDSSEARARAAVATLDGARATLTELQAGTRPEAIAQAKAALEAANARVREQQIRVERLHVRAPRDGIVDALPYRVGDQPPPGAPLATMLVGSRPIARIHVPSSMRDGLVPGSALHLKIEGRESSIEGRVRSIRAEPDFTPYQALSGDDASRLSWLAEVEIDSDEALPAGLPVRATR